MLICYYNYTLCRQQKIGPAHGIVRPHVTVRQTMVIMNAARCSLCVLTGNPPFRSIYNKAIICGLLLLHYTTYQISQKLIQTESICGKDLS